MPRTKLSRDNDDLLLEWVVNSPDEHADAILANTVTREMLQKLGAKRAEGVGGWFKPDCTNTKLSKMLMKHVQEGDYIDVINIAAMMLVRTKLYGPDA